MLIATTLGCESVPSESDDYLYFFGFCERRYPDLHLVWILASIRHMDLCWEWILDLCSSFIIDKNWLIKIMIMKEIDVSEIVLYFFCLKNISKFQIYCAFNYLCTYLMISCLISCSIYAHLFIRLSIDPSLLLLRGHIWYLMCTVILYSYYTYAYFVRILRHELVVPIQLFRSLHGDFVVNCYIWFNPKHMESPFLIYPFLSAYFFLDRWYCVVKTTTLVTCSWRYDIEFWAFERHLWLC